MAAAMAELWNKVRSRVADHHLEDLEIPPEGIFADTDRRFLELLIRASNKKIAVPDEILINHGERDDTFFLLLRGEVEVNKEAEAPGIKPFSRVVHSPNVFGEACALGLRHVRTATVKAISVCDLRTIAGEHLQSIIQKFRKDKLHFHHEAQARMDEQAAWVEKGRSRRLCRSWTTPEERLAAVEDPPAISPAATRQLSGEQDSRRTSTSGVSCVTENLSVGSCSATPQDTPRRSLSGEPLSPTSPKSFGHQPSQAAEQASAPSDPCAQDTQARHQRIRRQKTMDGSGWSYQRGRLKGVAPELPSAWMRSAEAHHEGTSPGPDGSVSESDASAHSVSTPHLPALSFANERAASPSVERLKAVELSAAVGAVGGSIGRRGRPRRPRPVKTNVAEVYGTHRQLSKESRSLSSHASSGVPGVCDLEPCSARGRHCVASPPVQDFGASDAGSTAVELKVATKRRLSAPFIEVSTESLGRSASTPRHSRETEVARRGHAHKGGSQWPAKHPLQVLQRIHRRRAEKSRNDQCLSPASSASTPRKLRRSPSASSPRSPMLSPSNVSVASADTGASSPRSEADEPPDECEDRVPSPSQVLSPTSKPRAASSRARMVNRGPREGWQKSLCQHVAVCYPSALPTKDTFSQRKVPRPVSPNASSPSSAQGRARQPCVRSRPDSPQGVQAEPDIFKTLLERHLEAGRGHVSEESESPKAPIPQEMLSPTRPPPQPPPGRRHVRRSFSACAGGTGSETNSAAALS